MDENKQFLKQQLQRSTDGFIRLVERLSPEQFEQNPNGKWSAGQDLAHLAKTLWVIGLGFRIPLGLFGVFFGTANRPSRPYGEFAARYAEKMSAGIQAPAYVLPKRISFPDRVRFQEKLKRQTAFLVLRVDGISEQDLDRYILPHPLFGKITVREMFMATWLHTDHHTALLNRKLKLTD